MNVLRRWKERRIAEVERAAREQDAAEAEAARQRVLEMARRQRDTPGHEIGPDPGQPAHTWHDPTFVLGLPLLTYGQQRLYRMGQRC
ncbi:hypothetical protein [Plantactinospora sp. KLBMP9567]|uniref:hypothetical protein n=1 Tax=Plantactinospora sp. KLBMP9567 TaxID=3085900 RepID=UPI00298183EE|nr:hypothetical protein [Plantactinospora sp. KLBMP9567]MDW5325623.1 hypothetical protein [Plantactinospora sp. KLBMP9567]